MYHLSVVLLVIGHYQGDDGYDKIMDKMKDSETSLKGSYRCVANISWCS